jgi:hypothetical protein
MFLDEAHRALLTAKLANVRQEIDDLHLERRGLNENAAGAEGDRHASIGARLRMLRDAERELNAPLMDAMEDDKRNAPK